MPGHHNDKKQDNGNKKLEKHHKTGLAFKSRLGRAKKHLVNLIKWLPEPVKQPVVYYNIRYDDNAVNNPADPLFCFIVHRITPPGLNPLNFSIHFFIVSPDIFLLWDKLCDGWLIGGALISDALVQGCQVAFF